MATNPLDSNVPGLPFFDIYSDPVTNGKPNSLVVPGGACNFVDLTPGANGAKCGCRRFWTRSVLGGPSQDVGDWCMCNHHACFHDEGTREGPATETRIPEIGQENERPRTGRDPLSPVVGLSPKVPLATSGPGFPSFGVEDNLSFMYNDPDFQRTEDKTIPNTAPPPGNSLPDTLGWGESYTSKAPPSPSQFLVPSQATSTTSSVQAKYLRPFAGKGLNTLSSSVNNPKPHSSGPQPGNPSPLAPLNDAKLEDSFVLVPHDKTPTKASSHDVTQREPIRPVNEELTRQDMKKLSDAVGDHGQRLERLENTSFSAVGNEDCQERHDHIDLRVVDLEGRMDEVEKQAAEFSNMASRLTEKTDDSATQSVASFSTAESRPSYSQEMYSQIQSLQAQVTSLQSVNPTTSRPWELEVVFLPFPLKKVWQDPNEFKADPSSDGADRSQLPMTFSSKNTNSSSPYGEWATDRHDAAWLFPKACGENSLTDKRLRSRGLVQKVTINGPDARSVDAAINTAFGTVWEEMQLQQARHSNPRVEKYLGLHSPWIPLTKIHKNSCLRFLSPAEMLTPASWTTQFLHAVIMKSTQPRLFITHPDAYLQDYHSYQSGWTWQRIRELSRVYSGGDSQTVPEADALEEYWSWNERLDDLPSASVPMSMRQENPHSASSSSSIYYLAPSRLRSSSPAVVTSSGITYLSHTRQASRPPHIRTTSLPAAGPDMRSPASAQRRVVSGGSNRRDSPSIRGISQRVIMKSNMKRQRTRSPGHHRFTPRWTGSPSPMPIVQNDRPSARGITPFAYATPHSNVPLQENHPLLAGSASPMITAYEFGDYNGLDELYEVEIYESGSEEDYVDESSDATQQMTVIEEHVGPDSQNRQMPEDEPWPGIEDQQQMSDEENLDPRGMDVCSEASSQPSEYPSTHNAWPNNGEEFEIHEDNN